MFILLIILSRLLLVNISNVWRRWHVHWLIINDWIWIRLHMNNLWNWLMFNNNLNLRVMMNIWITCKHHISWNSMFNDHWRSVMLLDQFLVNNNFFNITTSFRFYSSFTFKLKRLAFVVSMATASNAAANNDYSNNNTPYKP